MRKKILAGLTAGFAMAALWSGSVFATTLTMQDFESGSSASISGGTRTSTGGYANYGFGNYFQWSGGNAITLNLSGIDPHTTLDLEFDLAVIDSWDGSHGWWAPDYFNVILDNGSIFRETFTNFSHATQSYNGTPLTSGSNIYNNHWNDSAYHISLTELTHSSPTVVISWFANGGGWEGGWNESFAVDNIKVSIPNSAPVPEPATMLLLGTGLAGLAGTRIRRKKK